jgi:hypothetical protein
MFRKKRTAKKTVLTPLSNGNYSTNGKSPQKKERWDPECETHSDTQKKQSVHRNVVFRYSAAAPQGL